MKQARPDFYFLATFSIRVNGVPILNEENKACLLYTSDAADERSSVDLGGRRIIKKKKNTRISER